MNAYLQAVPPPQPLGSLEEQTTTGALVERRVEIKKRIKELETELQEINDLLKEEMVEGEIIFGSDGIGVEKTVTRKKIYGEKAIDFLESKKLLRRFVKISTTGLKALVKEKLLTNTEVAILEDEAEEQEINNLREKVNPEAVVFP